MRFKGRSPAFVILPMISTTAAPAKFSVAFISTPLSFRFLNIGLSFGSRDSRAAGAGFARSFVRVPDHAGHNRQHREHNYERYIDGFFFALSYWPLMVISEIRSVGEASAPRNSRSEPIASRFISISCKVLAIVISETG